MATTPPTIADLPAAPDITDGEEQFDAAANAFVAALQPFADDANDLADWMRDTSGEALAAAVAAAAGSLDEADRAGFAGQLVGVENGPGYPLAGFDVEEIPEATQAQAEAGTGTGVYMSPLRTVQAIEHNSRVVISVTELSGVANFDVALPVGYDDYELRVERMIPATDSVDVRVRTSADGATFDSGGSDYGYNRTDIASTTEPYINLNDGTFKVGGAAGEAGWFGTIDVFNATSATLRTTMRGAGGYISDGGSPIESYVVGVRNAAAVVRAVRFYFSSGNVASGRVVLTGRKV